MWVAPWLLAFALIGGINANPLSTPKEKIYAYHAETFVYNSVSSEDLSKFDIFADLIYQPYDEYAVIKLSEVKVSVLNGDVHKHEDVPKVDIPEHARVFMEPFIYYYNNTIAVKNNDAHWSINMKRSIAGILHAEKEVILKKEKYVEEENLYGHCDVKYKYEEGNGGSMKVSKVIDISKCKYTTMYIWPENNMAKCTKHNFMKREIERSYYFRDKSNLNEIDRIVSNYTFILKDSPEANQQIEMVQLQTFQLTHVGDIKEKIDSAEITDHKKLVYVPKGTPLEISELNKKLTTAELSQHSLDNLESLKEELLKPTTTNSHDIHFIVENFFTHMEDQTLESIEVITSNFLIDDVVKNLFMSVIPYLGNQETVKYMEKLIKSEDIEIYQKIKFLALFPRYVYGNDIKVLDFLLDLTTEENIVRNSGVLAHSELVVKALHYGAINETKYKEYIYKYLDVFRKSSDYETRMVYLLGLHNLNADLDIWMPIIMDSNESRHLRLIGIQSALDHIKKDPLKVKSDFMSLLKNESLSSELRIAALDTLIEVNMSLDMYDEIYEYLKIESGNLVHKHIYNYFYTKLRSNYVATNCFNPITDIAEKYFHKIDAPLSDDTWTSSNFKTSFTNTGSDYGASTEIKMIGAPNTKGLQVLQITFDNFAMNIGRKFSVFIKMHGVVEDILNDLNKIKSINDKYIKDFIKIIQDNKLKLQENSIDFHLEIILLVDDKVTFATYLDPTVISNIDFRKLYDNVMYFIEKDQISFSYPAMTYVYVPSDLGTDIEVSLEEEIINYKNIDLKRYELGSFFGDYKYTGRIYTTIMKSLEIFNPLSNLKHGASSAVIDNIYKEIPCSWNKVEDYNMYLQLNHSDVIYLGQSEILRKIYVNNEKTLHDYCTDCSKIHIIKDEHQEKFEERFDPLFFINLSYGVHGTRPQGEKHVTSFFSNKLVSATVGNFISFPLSYLEYILINRYYHRLYNPSWYTLRETLSIGTMKNESSVTTLTLKLINIDIENNDHVIPGEYGEITLGLNIKEHEHDFNVTGVNVTVYYDEKPGKRNTTFGLVINGGFKQQYAKVCLDWETFYPPEIADKYSVVPATPTSSKIIMKGSMSKKGPIIECPTEPMISIDIKGLYTVADNQKEHLSVQKCLKQSQGKKFNSPTLECEEAATIISTYQKYLFNGIMETTGEATHFFGPQHQNFSVVIEYIKTPKNYPKVECNIHIDMQTIFQVVLYPPIHHVHYGKFLLVNSREMFNTEISPRSTCAVTKDFINTFNNSIIENYDNNGEIVAWIECENGTDGLTYKVRDDNLLEMTTWIDEKKVVVKPDGNNLKVLLNDDEFDKSEWVRGGSFKIYFVDDNVLHIMGKKMSVFYTPEYINTEIYSFYNGMICGICSPQENIIKVKH